MFALYIRVGYELECLDSEHSEDSISVIRDVMTTVGKCPAYSEGGVVQQQPQRSCCCLFAFLQPLMGFDVNGAAMQTVVDWTPIG